MQPPDTQLRSSQTEQPPAQEREQRRFRRPEIIMLVVISFVLALLLLGGEVIGLFTQLGWLTFFPPPAGNTRPAEVQRSATVIPSPLLEGVAHHFMDALLQKNWREMWLMLHPDAKQPWQGEQDFLHFEQAKFTSITFIHYRLGSPRVEYSWRNPDTTRIYPFAVKLSASLEASAPAGLLSPPSRLTLTHGLFEHTLLALVQDHSLWRVLVAGPADLEAPILVPAKLAARKLQVPIFMYHHVSARPTHNLLDYNLTVTTNDFAQQLTWLQQRGYHSISETDLFDALYYGKALPAHPMMLTFDDGYEDMYTDAFPVLLQHQDRGVFYIITGMIGRNYMTWQQIAALARAGMQISSHTVHHVNVGQPPAGTSTQAELLVSKQTLERQLNQPVQFFCYPSGEPFHTGTLLQQRLVLADLFNDGYVGATLDPFSFFTAVQNGQTPYQLQRIRVSGGETLETFSGILNATLSNFRQS